MSESIFLTEEEAKIYIGLMDKVENRIDTVLEILGKTGTFFPNLDLCVREDGTFLLVETDDDHQTTVKLPTSCLYDKNWFEKYKSQQLTEKENVRVYQLERAKECRRIEYKLLKEEFGDEEG